MPISLYNSLTRRTEPFAPLDPARVTMYLCGPTVYNYVHIGNARGPVVFDVLVRLLRRHYPHVLYARNITDVDDKINAAAQQQGVPIGTITERFAQAYRDDMAGLGVAAPDIEPHATTHIGPIITMIERLLDGGHAYVAEGHVLFDVGSFPAYGELSGRDTDELIAGSRVEVAPYKRSPGDFVLWKPSTPDLPGWDSPWSHGRPGWHIECSAMSAAHLGDTIDIHAGGVDLLFPHHENEIAQSTCAHGGKVFARWWMHNGMLTFGGRKMSKSLGNVLLVHELLKLHPAEALRLVLLRGHYRQPLDWTDGAIQQAVSTLDGLYRVLRDLGEIEMLPDDEQEDLWKHPTLMRVEDALCDDLNTPEALVAIVNLAHQARQSMGSREHRRITKTALLAGGRLLGLLQQDPEAWFKRGENTVDAAHIEDLLQQRQAARAARDFARADAIRDELAAMHIAIEDSAQGTRWSVLQS